MIVSSTLMLALAPPGVASLPVIPFGQQRRIRREADVGRVDYPGGWFEEKARGRWEEFASDGRLKARFYEMERTRDWIDLDDPTRDLQIRLNLPLRTIQITERRGAWRRLYAITTTRPSGYGRGYEGNMRRPDRSWDSPQRPRDDVREVAVGPIWNQVDAQVKCKGAAIRERGEWTGQWRTVEASKQSVCEIRYAR